MRIEIKLIMVYILYVLDSFMLLRLLLLRILTKTYDTVTKSVEINNAKYIQELYTFSSDYLSHIVELMYLLN
jgi:hypothetical protein